MKTSKLRVTGLCAGNSPETGEFPAQMASNAENVSIWWRHHVNIDVYDTIFRIIRPQWDNFFNNGTEKIIGNNSCSYCDQFSLSKKMWCDVACTRKLGFNEVQNNFNVFCYIACHDPMQ